MEIAPQQFGTIGTGDGVADAMLCVDSDRPFEAMLHFWDGKSPANAVLVQLYGTKPDEADLLPIGVYRTNDNGGLWKPILTPEEIERAKGFRGRIWKNGSGLEGEWSHPLGHHGQMHFEPPSRSLMVSADLCTTWDDFKKWASRSREQLGVGAYRGHGSNKYRLQTTFHRVGRHRLERYCSDTLQEFRRHAEALLGERIDLNNGDDYSMLFGLAQHHGLPTPLLDLTSSPYVAAFFAFADALESASVRPEVTHVRVYGFTRDLLGGASTPVVTVPYFKPYLSTLLISPRNNPRLYAQQGQFLVTNVADVESFICNMERKSDRKFLIAADIPVSCAVDALEDLAFMGLTAATMFPGLDGVCRMMKHAMSFKREAVPLPPKPSDGSSDPESRGTSTGEVPQEGPVHVEADGPSAELQVGDKK